MFLHVTHELLVKNKTLRDIAVFILYSTGQELILTWLLPNSFL